MPDCLIIGGGVIGLSLAWELASKGRTVRVLDRAAPSGQQASWAAAGILPPALLPAGDGPIDRLWKMSWRLHIEWAERLKSATGIDNGYRRSGGLHIADGDTAAEWPGLAAQWHDIGAKAELLDPAAVADLEPALRGAVERGLVRAALFLPDEVQIRNPRHLKALRAACLTAGVEISADVEVENFDVHAGRIRAVRTSQGPIEADTFTVASGAWTGQLLQRLGLRAATKPIRGQMILLRTPQPIMRRVMYVGPHYFAPRDDGRMLVGSTLEDAGFDCRVTASAVGEFLEFARRWIPDLQSAEFERSWSGLRPQSATGKPYLGRLPGLKNGFIAAGHYRNGLTLSPGTAVVMAQLICGETPAIELDSFGLDE